MDYFITVDMTTLVVDFKAVFATYTLDQHPEQFELTTPVIALVAKLNDLKTIDTVTKTQS